MRPDVSEKVKVAFDLEGDAITLADTEFPNVVGPLHLFGVKRRMPGVREEEIEFAVDLLLDGLG